MLDMQPTNLSDPQRKYILYKAPAGGGGSDSNDGLSPATPLATFNEWWQRITSMNNNRCWPWLYTMPGTHSDSMDACCPIPGAAGLNLQSPTSGMGSFPVISGGYPGHPLEASGYAAMRDSCIITGAPGKVAFSAIWGANYTCVWLTLNTPGRACFYPNQKGIISGGNHRIIASQYTITAVGDGCYIGDGGLTYAPGSFGGIWLSSERGCIQMLPVPITFEGATTMVGATVFCTNDGYARLNGITWVNPSNVSGTKFTCQKGGGLETGTGTPQTFMPGTIAGTVQPAPTIPAGWAF